MTYGMQFEYNNFIKDVSPRNGESGVSLDKVIVVKFFDDVDVDSLRPENIILMSIEERKEVAIEYKYNHKSKTLRIQPKIEILPKSLYKLIIRGSVDGIKTITGDILPVSFTAEFTTGESNEIKSPEIVYPLNRTIVDAPLRIKIQRRDESRYVKVEISDTSDFHKQLYSLQEPMIFLFDGDAVDITPDIKIPEGRYFIRCQAMNDEGKLSEFSNAVHISTEGNMDLEEPPEIEQPTPEDENEDTTIEDINNNLEEDSDEDEDEVVVPEGDPIIGLHPKKDAIHIPPNLLEIIAIHLDGEIDISSVNNQTVYVVKERV